VSSLEILSEVKAEALLMPLTRGYGNLPSLHIALSQDDTLMQLVREFVSLTPDQFDEIPTLLENILYRWAGVDDVDPDSVREGNGSNVDARKLRFVEQFSGVTWEQLGNKNIVGQFAALDIKKTWDTVFDEMMNRFSVQGPMASIFTEATYNFAADKITLNATYSDIISRITALHITDLTFAQEIAHILYTNKTELNVSLATINQSLLNIFGQDFHLSDTTIQIDWGTQRYYDDLEKGNIQAVEDKDVLKYVGTDSAETVNASNLGDYIFTKGRNDTVNGGTNEDYIDGSDNYFAKKSPNNFLNLMLKNTNIAQFFMSENKLYFLVVC